MKKQRASEQDKVDIRKLKREKDRRQVSDLRDFYLKLKSFRGQSGRGAGAPGQAGGSRAKARRRRPASR